MNGALAPLTKAADVRYVFPEGKRRVTLSLDSLPLNAPYSQIPIDPIRQQTWRWILYTEAIAFRRGRHERAMRKSRRKMVGWKSALLLTLAGLPIGSAIFRRIVDRRMREHPNQALTDLLRNERPDAVLHPTVLDGVFINDLIPACKASGIPLILAMNSWDNPASKRAMAGNPDWLLVWGPQTKRHAVEYMKIPEDRAVPFGAAQFDVFKDTPRVNRTEFCRIHDIDPARRLILFAGSNTRTDEFATMNALDAAIEKGELPGCAIIYRPHPWGEGGRNGERIAEANWRHVRIHAPMRAYLEAIARGSKEISLPDYRDTHDVLSVVDMVVSPLSTILIEAVLHRKPIIPFVPLYEGDNWVIRNRLPRIHFDELMGHPLVPLETSLEGLMASINRLKESTVGERTGAELHEFAADLVTPFDRYWRDRVVEFIASVAARRTG